MISKKLKFFAILFFIFLCTISLYAEEISEKFEKGDAIYSDLGGGHNIFGAIGHAGLYYYWESTENGIAEPVNMEKHYIIESNKKLGVRGIEKKVTFKKFYDYGNFWGVRTIKLSRLQRQQIIATAKSKKDKKYAFFRGYKGSYDGRPDTFRCDGLVEYCYEQAGKDIVPGDTWSPVVAALPGRILLTPKKQMNYLADPARFEQYTPQFDLIKFGELEDAICIDGEPVEPDNDGYYHINKNCTIKVYASDGSYGSGIARTELWLEEPDDTPDEMPGKRLKVFNEEYKSDHDYSYDWNISDVEPGEYELYAKAFDQAGNTKETYINVKIEGQPYYFHVQLSPEYVETGSPSSQTQTFTITVQCYNYGTSETKPQVEGKRYVNKKAGTQSWWWYKDTEKKIAEWRKEKINPNCIVPEPWEKSDYAGEVSFGIANITNSAYELYVGEEKLEKITLADGAGSISGVVIKAKDGDISNDRLFLIIFASDGTGSGNNALMVNPILVPVSIYYDGVASPAYRPSSSGLSPFRDTADKAWNYAVELWEDRDWLVDNTYGAVFYTMRLEGGGPPHYLYLAEIYMAKARLTVDLTGYNSAVYQSAKLVVKPRGGSDTYYNEQGWKKDEYNVLKDMKGELGKIWISAEFYGDWTPSRPALNTSKGCGIQGQIHQQIIYQGFYVALIPKMPE